METAARKKSWATRRFVFLYFTSEEPDILDIFSVVWAIVLQAYKILFFSLFVEPLNTGIWVIQA